MNSTSAVLIIIKALSALSATAGAAIARPAAVPANPDRFDWLLSLFFRSYHCAPWSYLQCCFVRFALVRMRMTLQFGNKFAVANFASIGRFC